ncbi:hypothetical protein C8A03DRAFT_12422 [Achaetomium macrosporum]|uniref:Uncharacterized protein n=1 Tax=Achaetomium macrosporum TaxID=79813 RepID=A0AAN7CI93_9PEZI|nr:hypothetical protein C8A03DRAFT_12422 [Achaetomium macrosporum]
MEANHPVKPKGSRKPLVSGSGIKARPPVPSRYSSAVFPYLAGLGRTRAPEGQPEEEDPYLQALKQLSASHSPSLDNLPLQRPTPRNVRRPVPSHKAQQKDPQTGMSRDGAEMCRELPRTIGRRYHRLASGNVCVEFVDVSAHLEHHGHDSASKVRPAVGVPPFFNPPSQSGPSVESR